MLRSRLAVFTGWALLVSVSALADSWTKPEVESHLSVDGRFRFTVFPGSDDVQPDGSKECRGKLVEREDGGDWVTRWERELVNPIAPVEVLVADSGYVVTFDDWGSSGYGSNVVVIYARDGRLIRRLALGDFLTEESIKALPHSISSIIWGRGHYISTNGQTLLVRVLGEDDHPFAESPGSVTVPVRLADGDLVR